MRVDGPLWVKQENPSSYGVILKTAGRVGKSKKNLAILYKYEEWKYWNRTGVARAVYQKYDGVRAAWARRFGQHFWIWGNWVAAPKQKWTQEENRMLWKCYFESDKKVKGYMERMHWLWIERGDKDMTRQILRTQVQNIEAKKLLSDVGILWGQVEEQMT